MYEFTPVGWLKHVIFHPVEGFEDMRWKKAGSLKIAFIIVALMFVAMVADRQLTGFQFNTAYVKVFNVVPLLVQSIVYYFAWVIANWMLCTLFDGEGTLKKVCIYSAYALVPFIVGTFLAVFVSNFITSEETIWMTSIYYLGLIWSVVLMIQAMKAAHQYTFFKTIVSMLFTLVAMLLLLCDAAAAVPRYTAALSVPAGLRIRIFHLHRDRISNQRLIKKWWC